MDAASTQNASEGGAAVAAESHHTPAPACTSCPRLVEAIIRLTDTVERTSLQNSAAILHGKRESFGGPSVDDAVRDAIEIKNQIIKATNRGQA